MTTKKLKKEISRRAVGFNILPGPRCPPSFYLVYEVMWDDYSITTVQGATLRTLPGYSCFNGTREEKEEALRFVRTDLLPHISAAYTLLHPVIDACTKLDEYLKNKVPKKPQKKRKARAKKP